MFYIEFFIREKMCLSDRMDHIRIYDPTIYAATGDPSEPPPVPPISHAQPEPISGMGSHGMGSSISYSQIRPPPAAESPALQPDSMLVFLEYVLDYKIGILFKVHARLAC